MNTQIVLDSLSQDKDTLQEDVPLLNANKNEDPIVEFQRQRNMAQQCCDQGRKYMNEGQVQNAVKEFSKAVMTFQFILKNNVKQQNLKQDISDMLRSIILPAYSNLALGYLKMKKYGMVITFANQVLVSDSANVKNLYRRGLARKMTKVYDEAIQDFEKVITLDQEMKRQCTELIKECKLLQKQQKKKQKQVAKQLLQGYANDMPEPIPFSETKSNSTTNSNTAQQGNIWTRTISYIGSLFQRCPWRKQ